MSFSRTKVCMKRAITAVLLLTAASNSFSQDPEIKAGSTALLFSFYGPASGEWLRRGDDFYDGPEEAAEFENGIGAKYFFSESMAVRIGVQFANGWATIPANPPIGQQGIDGTKSALKLGFSAAVEIHTTQEWVSPYFGAGFGYSITSTEERTVEVGNPPSPPDIIKNEAFGVSIGGDQYRGETRWSGFAMAGFEFFVWKRMSLAGEYRFGFSSSSRKDETLTSGNITTTRELGRASGFEISTQGVLTLAIYVP